METTYEPDSYLTVEEVAGLERTCPKTIWRHIKKGVLKASQPGGPGTKVRIKVRDYFDYRDREYDLALVKVDKMYSGPVPVFHAAPDPIEAMFLNSSNPFLREMANSR
jgi:hypothetical protein